MVLVIDYIQEKILFRLVQRMPGGVNELVSLIIMFGLHHSMKRKCSEVEIILIKVKVIQVY